MKKRRTLSILLTLGTVLWMIPSMVVMADNPNVTAVEKIIKESTVYAGEVFVDGESQMRYLYSADITNTGEVFDSSDSYPSSFANALKGTAFSSLVPVITEQYSESNPNGLAISSAHQSEMNANWTSSSYVAGRYYTGAVGTETEKNLYDADAVYKKNLDDLYEEVVNTYDDVEPFNKRIHTLLTTTTDFVWVNHDGVLQKEYTITAKVEGITVIYTSVQIKSAEKIAEEKAITDQNAAAQVINKINEIGTVAYTDASKSKIDVARWAYDALTGDQKKLVTNYKTLTEAEIKYGELKTVADKAGEVKPADEKITVDSPPKSVKAKAKKNKITVTWKKINKKTKPGKKLAKQVKCIQVQIATDQAFTNIVNNRQIGRNKTKYVVKLKKKTTYYVRVRYVGKDGGFSKWSAKKKVKTGN